MDKRIYIKKLNFIVKPGIAAWLYNENALRPLDSLMNVSITPNPCEARELLLDLRNDILEIINLHKELTINELGKKYLGL